MLHDVLKFLGDNALALIGIVLTSVTIYLLIHYRTRPVVAAVTDGTINYSGGPPPIRYPYVKMIIRNYGGFDARDVQVRASTQDELFSIGTVKQDSDQVLNIPVVNVFHDDAVSPQWITKVPYEYVRLVVKIRNRKPNSLNWGRWHKSKFPPFGPPPSE